MLLAAVGRLLRVLRGLILVASWRRRVGMIVVVIVSHIEVRGSAPEDDGKSVSPETVLSSFV
jgi:hypothetical protein